VNMLLKAGLDPSVVDRKGWTALHYASESNRIDRNETVSMILEHDQHYALVHMKDNAGNSPLHVACGNNYGKEIVTSLLQYGAKCRDNLGMTPLLLACQQRNAYSVEKLLAIPRINADARDIHGNSVLHLCLMYGGYEAVRRLLDIGVDVQVHNNRGESPLWIA
ncbi:ankyrin repeat-containing domain protein, partial [Baffinella frigidus]